MYAASLCFSDHLVQQIIFLGEKLKAGARLVTLKVPAAAEQYQFSFELEKTVYVSLACGRTAAYVLRRK